MPQREITIHSGEARLEGVLALPEDAGPFPAVVVCHPHPQYGGSMDNNVVAAAAGSLLERGIAAVLFNFRGAGRSDGVPGNRDEALVDVVSALEQAAQFEELDAGRIGLAGYSFGAGAAAAVAGASVPALALISLPLSMAEDARGTLTAFTGPLLLLSGDEDEGSNEAGLRALAAACAGGAEVQIVPGADHF
jgi:alpha/beta superfamily hydrolase